MTKRSNPAMFAANAGRALRTALLTGISLSAFTAMPSIASAQSEDGYEDRSKVIASGQGMQVTLDPREQQETANPYSVQVRTDTTHIDPVLAVSLADSDRVVINGEQATFVSYTNYPSFIDRAEVRIFRAGVSVDAEPLAIAKAGADGFARWTPTDLAGAELYFVYRVYDGQGNFDETQPNELTVLKEPFEGAVAPIRPLFGTRDTAAIRNIQLSRSVTITVTGTADTSDESVSVAGQYVPIEDDGRFVSQQIVSNQVDTVEVVIGTSEKVNYTASRNVDAAKDEWFIVGQGDLTLVSNNGSGTAVEVSGDSLTNGTNVASRAAFYAKGKLKSGISITASLDTGETLLEDIFSNLDRKDPRQLLRRLDTNEFYTTYGDDSTLVEDAPTQGRFYLRVEKDKSSLLIGNFIADIQQAELAQLNRGLFGAIVDHKSIDTTSFGESKAQFTAFASDPGTIAGRDEFRGTGGSLYFLNRRDISIGSERLSVEIRDRDTGLLVSRRDLRSQEDYDIDYFQGRILLLSPLASTAADGSLVRQSSGPGNIPVLVARYEYSPAVGDLDGYTIGGRGAAWIGDTLRLGATIQRETTFDADQTLLGADAILRLHAGTYIKGEIAQSDGPGFGQTNSVDGGLTFTDFAAPGIVGVKAKAYRSELGVNFAELLGSKKSLGHLSAFYEQFDAGFSANSQLTQTDTKRWGYAINAPLSSTTQIDAKFERLETDQVGERTVASADLTQKLSTQFSVTAGVRHDDQAIGLINNSSQSGERTDVALQVDFDPLDANWSIYGFGQLTVDRDAARERNNRIGLGGKADISDRSSLSAEVSDGDGGLGANVELAHRYGNGSEAYLGYGLYADRTDLGLNPVSSLAQANRGSLTLGTRHRFSTALSINGENRIGHGGEAPSVVRSYGLNWDPTARWSFSGSFETGRIDDVTSGLFKRTAATVGLGYTGDQIQVTTNVEARFEDGETRDQNVWLVRNTASVQMSPDWRALGRLNFAIADSNTDDIRLADFVEGTIGFAYRPVLNDRFNLLARYTFLEDLGPIGQVTSGGQTSSPKQRSNIISVDGNYDLTKTLTFGAKYAYREGSVSLSRESDVFVSSITQLGVTRLDWRLVKEWDFLIEGHLLTNDIGGDDNWGGLAAIYRHVGTNAKVGVGYSFSDFSTDLADQSYSSDGFFINLLGKF